ncbi:hypothetical protein M8C13_12185 [Crossiella sp. SN42]|uniref:hypothetical protein n=1 Tax=Crossiella sp. SN42 TaxID=2944808 RepID=UPI00207C59E4|nr:hypothetical protein [Crossiella sp. SN42]MCO1576509.1 hypothetical protein [Crossiella sp. SN42]
MRGPAVEWRGLWGALGVLAGVFGMLVLPLLADATVAEPAVLVRAGDEALLRSADGAGSARVDLSPLAGFRQAASQPPDSVSAAQGGASCTVELKTGVVDPAVTFARIGRLYALQGRPVTPVGELRTANGLTGLAGEFDGGTLVLLGGPGPVVTVSARGLSAPVLRGLLDGVVVQP